MTIADNLNADVHPQQPQQLHGKQSPPLPMSPTTASAFPYQQPDGTSPTVAASRSNKNVFVKRRRSAADVAFCAKHEAEAACAVPLEVRLMTLLAEGRRYELQRAAGNTTRQQSIRQAYAKLAEDVRRRCACIRNGTPKNATAAAADGRAIDPARAFSIGSEAINCFASMLPFSCGLASPPTALATMPTMASSSTSLSWSVPDRLSLDESKLAAVQASRVQRLDALLRRRATPSEGTGSATPRPMRA